MHSGPRSTLHLQLRSVLTLCERAIAAGKDGITLVFDDVPSAMKARSSIYALRKGLSDQNLLSASPIFHVEMKLQKEKDCTKLLIRPVGAFLFDSIYETATGKPVRLEMPRAAITDIENQATDLLMKHENFHKSSREEQAELLNNARLEAAATIAEPHYSEPQTEEEARALIAKLKAEDKEWDGPLDFSS